MTYTTLGMEVILGTGQVKLPNFDGTFSDISISDRAGIFLCLTDIDAYQSYADDSEKLYQAWQAGEFDSEAFQYSGTTSDTGRRNVIFDAEPENNIFYVMAIANYDSEEYIRSYYIARIFASEYTGGAAEIVPHYVTGAISNASSWSVIPEPMSASLIVFGLAAIALRRKVV